MDIDLHLWRVLLRKHSFSEEELHISDLHDHSHLPFARYHRFPAQELRCFPENALTPVLYHAMVECEHFYLRIS